MSVTTNPADGIRLSYSTAGSDEKNVPDVMLVHGSALSSSVWRGFGYVRALGDRYRLILPDLRGHGRSDTPHEPDAYAMDRIVGDLLAVLDAADVERVHYVGYSFGARAGLALALAAPERVAGLVLLGGSARPQRGAMDAMFFRGCVDVLERDGMEGFVREWERQRQEPVDAATRAAFLANDPLALAAYFRRSDLEPGIDDEALASLDVPTIAVAGSEDHMRVDDTRAMSRAIPGARLAVLRGFDHATTVAALPEVLSVIEPFLEARTVR
ncbi:alpha/beta fold hydrolase [Rhodococcus sp. NPDC058639]|uniref:alpha/beta fold hydrolase n=1 Tax=Rhodococcus sp. NPDC058639 TaxID=3346570 RepID=UPI003667F707